MRVKVTTEIDINLKQMFEATKAKHGKTYKEVLESGISALLAQYDPIGELQARITLQETELAEARQELARMRILQPDQKRIIEFEVKTTAHQAKIEDWLDHLPAGSLRLVQQGTANWKRLAPVIGAATPQQAQEWVMDVVKSWKAKYESGATK